MKKNKRVIIYGKFCFRCGMPYQVNYIEFRNRNEHIEHLTCVRCLNKVERTITNEGVIKEIEI